MIRRVLILTDEDASLSVLSNASGVAVYRGAECEGMPVVIMGRCCDDPAHPCVVFIPRHDSTNHVPEAVLRAAITRQTIVSDASPELLMPAWEHHSAERRRGEHRAAKLVDDEIAKILARHA